MPKPTVNLSGDIKGIWLLQTREDYTKEGQNRIDPTLGESPLGILAYGDNCFTAQFMKLDRGESVNDVSHSGTNNTIAVGGYDAYFGVYEVNEETGQVKHTLKGSINKDNTGISVCRDLRVRDGKLIIQLETTTIEGEPIIRTLIWERDDIK